LALFERAQTRVEGVNSKGKGGFQCAWRKHDAAF
jgi:hypothetical protein